MTWQVIDQWAFTWYRHQWQLFDGTFLTQEKPHHFHWPLIGNWAMASLFSRIVINRPSNEIRYHICYRTLMSCHFLRHWFSVSFKRSLSLLDWSLHQHEDMLIRPLTTYRFKRCWALHKGTAVDFQDLLSKSFSLLTLCFRSKAWLKHQYQVECLRYLQKIRSHNNITP